MMKMADVAVTADASDFLNNLIRELKTHPRLTTYLHRLG